MLHNVDEKKVKETMLKKRIERITERAAGAWGTIPTLLTEWNFKDRWLLYVAAFISAILTGASIFIIVMGESGDMWRMVFAAVMALVGVFVCEPAVLWWLQRVEYHQNKIQLWVGIFGLVFSAGLSARTILSAGELIVWALGDNVFSNYTSISGGTQDWLVHFIPYLVMVHVSLGLIYFSVSAESASRRVTQKATRASADRILTAKAEMEADTAEVMADAMSSLLTELAPKVGIKRAQQVITTYLVESGFDTDRDGKINQGERQSFNEFARKGDNQAKIRDAITEDIAAGNNGLHPTNGTPRM